MKKALKSALPHFVLQDRGEVGVRVAGMNDDGQPAVPGGGDMGAENSRGNVTRCLVVMIIESGFANAYAFRVPGQLNQTVLGDLGFFMQVMRMRPNRAKHVVIGLSEPADRTKSFRACRNGDHPPKPSGAGA